MQISEQPRHARTQAKVELMTLVSGEGVRPLSVIFRTGGPSDGRFWRWWLGRLVENGRAERCPFFFSHSLSVLCALWLIDQARVKLALLLEFTSRNLSGYAHVAVLVNEGV